MPSANRAPDACSAHDPFGALAPLPSPHGDVHYYRVARLAELGLTDLGRLPFSIRVLLENVLRRCDGYLVTEDDVRTLAGWRANDREPAAVPFTPARVLLQDFTGVPAIADLAAMRSAVSRLGGDPKQINPIVPVDLVIDHSVQTDEYGSLAAFEANAAREYERNRERYVFLRWAQQAFENLRVLPPDTGICHQVNLEHLAPVVQTARDGGLRVAYPDTVVGTDSHTTTINGLGVLGWGVGGIEAEAVMLGQPISLLVPDVIGVRLSGRLREGVTATDLVLTVTQLLRKRGVVDKFVEFFGPGLAGLTLADRAVVGNMAPEYGATMGFFAVDDVTLAYLRETGRDAAQVALVEAYCRAQGLFREANAPEPEYTDVLDLDLGSVEASLAGPRRPQDRVALSQMKAAVETALPSFKKPGQATSTAVVDLGGVQAPVSDGFVAIASITSCTNTSNPALLVAAGLVAKKAVGHGLKARPYVKTSFAPGSPVVADYLDKAGLTPYLEALGFHNVGLGCMSCIGNSGPLPEPVAKAVREGDVVAAAVLSGNRNFEGRVNPDCKMNFLASPPLVVAYALAGRVDADLTTEPLGSDPNGHPVYLRDVWPTSAEVAAATGAAVDPADFARRYAAAFDGDARWRDLSAPASDLYEWDADSTYIQEPPFFAGLGAAPAPAEDVRGARVLAVLGDSITTDHISPAGNIARTSPAARYLTEHGVDRADFNSYGCRRGNHEVLLRGAFANIRLRNQLAPGTEGGVTVHLPSDEEMAIYDVAMRYVGEGTPLLVVAGKEYGCGSSRDWAAKGPLLLGVRAVLAESYERIHRSNLIGMGVLPLQFRPGETLATLGLTGRETFDVEGIAEGLAPRSEATIRARRDDGSEVEFKATVRLESPVELDYYLNGGILQTVLRKMLAE